MKDGKIEKNAMRLIIQHSKFQIRNSNLAPSLQGFLSPGNGGNEGGVKTIEAGGEVIAANSSI
jgi:hypothetical protein